MKLEAIYRKLRADRRRRGIHLDSISIEIGVSSKTLHSWEEERTQPRADRLVAWAKALGFFLAIEVKPTRSRKRSGIDD